MLAKDIEYGKLSEMLNSYAIEKLYDILEKYGVYANKETIEEVENKILTNKIIVVNHPNPEDDEFFNNDIPFAHGPQTKNDGLIHFYPYTRCKDIKTTEELFNYIIENGIITHQIFHFFIKLDDPKITDSEEKEFYHYITEGMVQSFTEEHENKEFPENEYRKSVILANKLRSLIPSEYSANTIFRNNYTDIRKMYPETEEVFQSFKIEKEFLKQFKELLKELEKIIGINYQDLYKGYNEYTIEETIEAFKEQISNSIQDEVNKDHFKDTIDNIYQKLYTKKEKRL